MVNLSRVSLVSVTQALLGRHPNNVNQDKYWRKRQIFKMSAHFYGRSRNCFSLAVRRVHRALQYVTVGRHIRKEHMKEVWENRISAGNQEFGYLTEEAGDMLESLARSEIYLNRQTLSNLAIWEPRTYKSINMVAAVKAKQEGINKFKLGPPSEGIYTRGKL